MGSGRDKKKKKEKQVNGGVKNKAKTTKSAEPEGEEDLDALLKEHQMLLLAEVQQKGAGAAEIGCAPPSRRVNASIFLNPLASSLSAGGELIMFGGILCPLSSVLFPCPLFESNH